MNLSEMIRSGDFQAWLSDTTSNYILFNPELYDRIHKAAENGSEGRTHAEVIDEWRDYLDSIACDLTDEECDIIEQEINAREQWHIDGGTIDHAA